MLHMNCRLNAEHKHISLTNQQIFERQFENFQNSSFVAKNSTKSEVADDHIYSGLSSPISTAIPKVSVLFCGAGFVTIGNDGQLLQ